MSDLMLKIVGAMLVALPVIAFFAWAYREMGAKYFLNFLVSMAIGFAAMASIFIGMGLLTK